MWLGCGVHIILYFQVKIKSLTGQKLVELDNELKERKKDSDSLVANVRGRGEERREGGRGEEGEERCRVL